MKYLVKQTTWFVDGHGTPYEGSFKLFFTSDERYKKTFSRNFYRDEILLIPSDEEYDEDLDGPVDLNKSYGFEGTADGYLHCLYSYNVHMVDEELSKKFQTIIDNYNSMIKLLN